MSDVETARSALPQKTPKGKAAIIALTIPLLVSFEGFRSVAVHERIDPPGVYTVCFGRTNYDDPKIRPGVRYTKAECETFVSADLEEKYLPEVNRCIHVPLPPHRGAAVLDFTYNLGGGALCKSSVARKLNAGDVRGGCNAMLLYDRANGRQLPGLARRRRAERALCLMEN